MTTESGYNQLTPGGGFAEPVHLMGESLPGASVDLLDADITPTRTFGTYEYRFCPSNAGVLSVIFRKTGESDRTQTEYGGATLTAGAAYPARIIVPVGWSVNFRYSGADSGTYDLIVREI